MALGRFCLRRDLVEKNGSLDAAKAAFQTYEPLAKFRRGNGGFFAWGRLSRAILE